MKDLATVQILRTNGTSETHEADKHGLLHWIREKICAECIDAVNLRDGDGRLTGFVMIVDDHGWETETIRHPDHIEIKPIRPLKPVNAEATRIYLAQCQPGTTHQIAGDVAIACDRDFA